MTLLASVHPRDARATVAWTPHIAQARGMRLRWSLLLAYLLMPAWSGHERRPLLGARADISVTPVALDPREAAARRVGDLVFLGGVQLSSPDPAFGGFSALRVAGDRFTLLSDGGNVVRFRLDRAWRLSDPSFAELPDGPGRGWEKGDRDSEAMSADPRTGAVWVGFETSNELWRYDAALARVEGHGAPPAIRRWPVNAGSEAMTALPGGGLAMIAEATPWPHRKGRGGVVFTGDPLTAPRRGFRFDYVPPPGYDPTDMVVLPDGRWLVLNRYFSGYGFASALTVIDARRVRPGATVTGRTIATLAAPLIHDNFEGLAITREGGATIVWLVSDDNQLWPLQRSLLLKFRLEPPPPARRRR